jgi:hypothetical protein
VTALREAGIGLDAIRKLLGRRLLLADVLKVRLEALETEIASLQRVAIVLRATLRVPHPEAADLRRLWTMTRLSKAQLRIEIERFFAKVVEGVRVDETWKRQMIDVSTPALPEDPSVEQIDAWNELMAMITDEDFIGEMRANMVSMWREGFDPDAYLAASQDTFAKVRDAIAAGQAPHSPVGQAMRKSGWSVRRDR